MDSISTVHALLMASPGQLHTTTHMPGASHPEGLTLREVRSAVHLCQDVSGFPNHLKSDAQHYIIICYISHTYKQRASSKPPQTHMHTQLCVCLCTYLARDQQRQMMSYASWRLRRLVKNSFLPPTISICSGCRKKRSREIICSLLGPTRSALHAAWQEPLFYHTRRTWSLQYASLFVCVCLESPPCPLSPTYWVTE